MANVVCPKCHGINVTKSNSLWHCKDCLTSWNNKSEFTFNEAKKIAEQMGIIDAGSLIRTLQVLNIINLKAEPKEAGLPVGFHFKYNKYDELMEFCNELYKQGFEIKKKD
jgi:hypothetical protein